MKLYEYTAAPNPLRVRMFLAEKEIEIEKVQIDLGKGEQFSEAFRKINPLCDVPVLQLDDGTCISQVNAICRYFEEAYPDTPLFGRNAVECAMVESQDHQAQIGIGMAGAEVFRNTSPGFKDRALTGPHNYAQIPALAERGLLRVGHAFEDLNKHFAQSQFMVGDYFSIADITAYAFIGFARWSKLTIPEQCTDLQRWFNDVKSRPSAQA